MLLPVWLSQARQSTASVTSAGIEDVQQHQSAGKRPSPVMPMPWEDQDRQTIACHARITRVAVDLFWRMSTYPTLRRATTIDESKLKIKAEEFILLSLVIFFCLGLLALQFRFHPAVHIRHLNREQKSTRRSQRQKRLNVEVRVCLPCCNSSCRSIKVCLPAS